MKARFIIPAFGALLMASACAPTTAAVDPAAGAAMMDSLRADYAAAFKAGDAARMAAHFAPEAAVMEPGQPTAIGPAAVETMFKSMFEMLTPVGLELTPDKAEFTGDLAYERGRFKLMATMKPGGEAFTDEGRYLVVLKRQSDGVWKLVADMGNSPIAPPAPPPAPAK